MRRVLLLDERILADGRHARTHATVIDERLRLRDDDGTEGELSIAAVDRVMTRSRRPLEDSAADGFAEPGRGLPGGFGLRRLRSHVVADATGRDYLVWDPPDGDPLAAVGTMVTS